MHPVHFLAVGIGAALGAVLRWLLGLLLNSILPAMPLGTLAANLLGALLMGVAMAMLAQFEALPVAWRLALTTGFLGGLTTFSTFSAETASLLLREQYAWAATVIGAHLVGSLAMTLGAFALVRSLLRA